MFNLVRQLTAPVCSICLLMLGSGFFITYTTIRMEYSDASPADIGWIHSLFYTGLFVGAITVEGLVRRVGHIRSYAVFSSILTASILAQGAWIGLWSWMLLRLIAGYCTSGVYVIIESWFLVQSTPKTRGAVLSLYMTALYAAQTASQFFLDILDIPSMTPYMLSAGICALSAVPIAVTYQKSPEFHNNPSIKLRSLATSSPFGFGGCFVAGMILSAIYAFVPSFAHEMNLHVSTLIATTILGGFLLQWPIGRLSDIFDRRAVLLALCFLVTVPCAGIILFPHWYPWVLTLSFILGGLCFTIYPISITQVCDRVQPDDIVAATGMLLLAYGLGSVAGPRTVAIFMHYLSPIGLYVYIGSAAVALGFLGFASMLNKPPVPDEEQGEFVALPRGTAMALELDPRIDDDERQ